MQQLFEAMQKEWSAGRNAVLVSVVGKSGSVPRGSGAQMLVGSDGLLCGTIGGGPAEFDAVHRAQELLKAGQSGTHHYVLRQNPAEDLGAVCGGDVTVAFHFAPVENADWAALAQEVLDHLTRQEPAYLILSDMPILSPVPTERFSSFPLPIRQRAIIFGAGHCSAALCPLLDTLGFRVTVFDDRPDWNTAERFPTAEKRIVGDFERIGDYLTLTGEDYVVVMTSGHGHDYQVERQVLGQNVAYLGVMGSHGKTAVVNEKLRSDGFEEAAIAAVHAPIGTAIGAVTPEELAVSIAGEMIRERAARREQSGTSPHGCPVQ